MKRILWLFMLVFTLGFSTSFGTTADLTTDQEMIFTIDDDVGYDAVKIITVEKVVKLETFKNSKGISADMLISFESFVIIPEKFQHDLHNYDNIFLDKLEPPNKNNLMTPSYLIYYNYHVARDKL